MRLTDHLLVALALAAWGASLVHSDARPRGAKPPNAGRHVSAPVGGAPKLRGAAAPALPHGGGISGTGMSHPGATPGVVGGPAKFAGGITGTGMKRRAH